MGKFSGLFTAIIKKLPRKIFTNKREVFSNFSRNSPFNKQNNPLNIHKILNSREYELMLNFASIHEFLNQAELERACNERSLPQILRPTRAQYLKFKRCRKKQRFLVKIKKECGECYSNSFSRKMTRYLKTEKIEALRDTQEKLSEG